MAPPPPSVAANNAARAAAGQPATFVQSFAQVSQVIDQRCALCHNAQVQSKGVALHTPELLPQHARTVYQQSVVLKLMPFNNATGITDDERARIKRWFEAGAPVD